MFVLSMRCRNLKKKLLLACGAAAVCVAVIACAGYFKSQDAALTAPAVEQTLQTKTSLKVPDNDSRVQFLSAFGWELETEPAEVVEVAIPKEFGDVYLNYNEIQKLQGFDLTKYQGKKVKRYTYIVVNYPEHPENIRANLLVYKDKVIGGDICSLEAANGFMHGFTLTDQAAQESSANS